MNPGLELGKVYVFKMDKLVTAIREAVLRAV
jgi:hypothetical protein